MKNILIIRSETMVRPDVLEKHRKDFMEQIKTGVLVLPSYFKAEIINVPDDIDVMVRGGTR